MGVHEVDYKQDRATLLERVDAYPPGRPARDRGVPVSSDDYVAVPLPVNLASPPVGDCLVWLWTLNADGYGVGAFPGDTRLAHRQAFLQSRGRRSGLSVLHLCHRPFCVQPSHLYEGTHKDNSDDRRLRVLRGIDFPLFEEKSGVVQRVARYRWESPPLTQPPLLAPEGAGHECRHIIPAGDLLICPTCDNPEDPRLRVEGQEPRFQPPRSDHNSHEVVKRRKSFREWDGMMMSTEAEVAINIPANRSERRRRDKAAGKHPADGPVLLGPPVRFDPAGPGPVSFDVPARPDLVGPGIVMIVAQRIPRPSP